MHLVNQKIIISGMRKTLFTGLFATIIYLFVSSPLQAEPISRQQARQRAVDFLRQQNSQVTLSTAVAHKAPSRSTGATSDQAYYYVFNADVGQGFVIASGDDCARPVLAYSEQGTFDIDSIPEGMRYLLQSYADQIAWAQERGLAPYVDSPLKASRVTISHLVESSWDQESPYYNNCPKTKSGLFGSQQTCLTGCVATAMAQVLYYWGRQKGYNSIGSTAIPAYTTNSNSISVDALEAVNAFDWSSMTASKPTSTAAKTAVATLMRYCGQSVNMDYGTSSQGGSGAYNFDVPYAFKNYFGLAGSARYLNRSDFSDAEWDELIYDELAAGRPVVYGGASSSTGGHCFVCDGYDSQNNRYYFNWGWSGSYNSTSFALSALTPGSYNFNSGHDAIVGIQPKALETPEQVAQAANVRLYGLDLKSGSTLLRDHRSENGASSINLMGLVQNTSGMDLNLETTMGIYDTDGNFIGTTDIEEKDYDASTGIYYFMKQFSFGEELPYGTYKLIPLCRQIGTDAWNTIAGGRDYYVQAVVDAGGAEIHLAPAEGIQVTVKQTGSNNRYTNTATITNVGCKTFTGSLYVVVDDDYSSYSTISVSSLAPGASVDKTFTYKYAITSTTHKLSIEGLAGAYYTNQPKPNLTWECDWPGSDDDNHIFRPTYDFVVRLTNTDLGDFSGPVVATLYEHGKAESTGESKTIDATIAAGETNEYTFSFNNVVPDKVYNLKFTYDGETYYFGQSGTDDDDNIIYYYPDFSFTMSKGISVGLPDDVIYHLDADGILDIPENALYVDARTSADLTTIGDGGNANTLYLLPESATVPSALVGRNVVVDGRADAIAIDDALGFATPVDFTATQVAYRRTLEAGASEEAAHWQTFVVPFDVDEVCVGEKAIDWYHSADDTGKQFWVMAFTGEDEEGALFGHAEQIAANKPYLIAVPGNAWGEACNLEGQQLTFSGSDVSFSAEAPKGVVSHGGKYDFIGRVYQTVQHRKYVLTSAGDRFAYADEFTADPFRAYFVAYDDLGAQADVNLPMPMPVPAAPALSVGDVNSDGLITIADVTALVNIILGKGDAASVDQSIVDVNGDKKITIADVTALVNRILGQQ